MLFLLFNKQFIKDWKRKASSFSCNIGTIAIILPNREHFPWSDAASGMPLVCNIWRMFL